MCEPRVNSGKNRSGWRDGRWGAVDIAITAGGEHSLTIIENRFMTTKMTQTTTANAIAGESTRKETAIKMTVSTARSASTRTSVARPRASIALSAGAREQRARPCATHCVIRPEAHHAPDACPASTTAETQE